MTGKFVAYYRVSTTKQGINGLGMDAQKQAVANYLNGGDLFHAPVSNAHVSGLRLERIDTIRSRVGRSRRIGRCLRTATFFEWERIERDEPRRVSWK